MRGCMEHELHVMLDIETTGRGAGCGVLSIGAVQFCPSRGCTLEEFYTEINRTTCRLWGLHEEPQTLEWWSSKAPSLRHRLAELETHGSPILSAVQDLADWVHGLVPPRVAKSDVRVWSNGPSFTVGVLEHIMHGAHIQVPWASKQLRCYRTYAAMYPEVPRKPSAQRHHALQDARAQADHAIRLIRYHRASPLWRGFQKWS